MSRASKRFVSPGHHRSVDEFRAHLQALAPELDADEELLGGEGPLGSALRVGSLRLGNRFAIQPMEGWDGEADGTPSDHTRRRWRRFGESGAQLIWGGEAFAVQEDGRANPRQLFLNPRRDMIGALAGLRREVIEGHRLGGRDDGTGADGDPVIGLQLTHSGRFSRPTASGPAPRVAYRHPVLDGRLGDVGDPLTDGELEGIGERFVAAAAAARDAGFDFVDVKCCHGYLLHELLGARARKGAHGGDFAGRTRLLRRIVAAIRRDCPTLEIAVRVSIADVFPHSKNPESGIGEPRDWRRHVPYEHGFGLDRDDPRRFDLEEPLRFLALLRDLDIRLVNLTLGSPYYCPHLQRPATFPPSDGYLPPEDPLAGVAAHLRTTRACKEAFGDLVVVGTGYSYLQQWLPHVAQHEIGAGHVDLVGLGRMVLSYPELPRDVLARRPLRKGSICRTFSDCTTAPRHDLVSGCYPLDPHYKDLPEAQELRKIKKRLREGS